jgi:eukaryotic-like serine/threonine-protein kinase
MLCSAESSEAPREQRPASVASGALLEGTRYRACYRLAQGGMGEVFVAEHLELQTAVVVKLLHPALADRADLVERMRIEGRALALLRHPNIVSVIDAGRTRSGRPFLVMEHLNGRTLGAELRARGALPWREALAIARGVLAGLAAAHAAGIVHRDIKTENVLLHALHDGSRVAKLLDFGVAKLLGGALAEPSGALTQHGVLVGTPGYLSPEQVLGCPADRRSDLYAVGVVLYKMLTGRRPFDQAAAQLQAPPRPPSAQGARISPVLDAVVLKALHQDPKQRFQTAAELAQVLAELERAPGSRRRARRPVERGPAMPVAMRALVTGLTAGLVAALTAWVMVSCLR